MVEHVDQHLQIIYYTKNPFGIAKGIGFTLHYRIIGCLVWYRNGLPIIYIFTQAYYCLFACLYRIPDGKNNGANMEPTWVLSAPDVPHVGPMNLAIRVILSIQYTPMISSFVFATGKCVYSHQGPLLLTWLEFTPAWISNYISIMKSGMKLLVHILTSMVQPLKFGSGKLTAC